MALHEQAVGKTDEWYTPPRVFDAMGVRFDVDVASPGLHVTPWVPAGRCIQKWAGSLACQWTGFVWMNPPFGARNGLVPWLAKFMAHGNGVALVPDRTSAPWWQTYAEQADLMLFVTPKIRFIGADGKEGTSPAQGTTLLACGPQGIDALRNAHRAGLGLLAVPGGLSLPCVSSSEQDRPTTGSTPRRSVLAWAEHLSSPPHMTPDRGRDE